MDGVPAIIIDPKGDLANLLLTFPGLRGEDFRPWINAEDGSRVGQTPDEFAAARVGGVGAGRLAVGGAGISGVADGGAVGCGRDFAFAGEGMELLYFDVLDALTTPLKHQIVAPLKKNIAVTVVKITSTNKLLNMII